jgi:hypothetical protein
MGFDKLMNFFIKNLSYDIIENLNINSNSKNIITNHIMFDISFIIYQNLNEIEEEINNLIKIILALPFNFNDNIIQKKLLTILSLDHWKWYKFVFDGLNEDVIIKNFISTLTTNCENETITILDKIIIIKIINRIIEYIEKVHNTKLVKTINIFFDGIPSLSKIIEQRRRRLKHYLESQERKNNFNDFFDIDNSFQEYENLSYDYLKWLKYRYTIDKSLGPTSLLTLNLEKIILDFLQKKYKNIKINISSGNINGEADYKIFKFIYENNYSGDITIHTIDSDLVHQIIVQQNYFNITNKDITLSVIRYNSNLKNSIQYIEANLLIKNIEKIYTKNISSNLNSFIIYDLCLIFYFFGNDHLPASFEIGPELNLDFFLKSHWNVFKNNSSIVSLVNDKIVLSFENLKLFLSEINNKNKINKTKIIISRFFKVNNMILNFLTDKLELDFQKIILLCKKLLFDDGKINTDLDHDDIRYKLINKYKTMDFPFNINSLSQMLYKEGLIIFDKLLNILDISDTEENFCGLPTYNKPFFFVNDNNYQNLYFSFTENISSELEKKNPLIYDYNNINSILENESLVINNTDIEYLYLKKIYHLVTTLFGNMKNYNCNNFTYYKYYDTPSVNSLIIFLENNKFNFDKEISNETVDETLYFNSINHHIIITPYLKDIVWKFKSDDLNFLIKNLNIKNFWFENNENFRYKDFDIDEFLNQWFNSIIKLNISQYNFQLD